VAPTSADAAGKEDFEPFTKLHELMQGFAHRDPGNTACILLVEKQDLFRLTWAFCHTVPAKLGELCVWNMMSSLNICLLRPKAQHVTSPNKALGSHGWLQFYSE